MGRGRGVEKWGGGRREGRREGGGGEEVVRCFLGILMEGEGWERGGKGEENLARGAF